MSVVCEVYCVLCSRELNYYRDSSCFSLVYLRPIFRPVTVVSEVIPFSIFYSSRLSVLQQWCQELNFPFYIFLPLPVFPSCNTYTTTDAATFPSPLECLCSRVLWSSPLSPSFLLTSETQPINGEDILVRPIVFCLRDTSLFLQVYAIGHMFSVMMDFVSQQNFQTNHKCEKYL